MGAIGRSLALARRRGITRGLLGGSSGWLLLGLAAWGLRGLSHALRPPEPLVSRRLRLRPGDRLLVAYPRRGEPSSRT